MPSINWGLIFKLIWILFEIYISIISRKSEIEWNFPCRLIYTQNLNSFYTQFVVLGSTTIYLRK